MKSRRSIKKIYQWFSQIEVIMVSSVCAACPVSTKLGTGHYTSLIKCFSRFLGMEAVLLSAHKIDKAVRKQLSNGIRDFIARIPVDRTNADHVSMIVILDVIGENGSIG